MMIMMVNMSRRRHKLLSDVHDDEKRTILLCYFDFDDLKSDVIRGRLGGIPVFGMILMDRYYFLHKLEWWPCINTKHISI